MIRIIIIFTISAMISACSGMTAADRDIEEANAEDISLCKKGWSETQSGSYEKAVKLFRQCIETGHLTTASLARTYRNIGITNKRSGQFDAAIKSYNKALALLPDDSWADYVNRGNALSELGDYEKAFSDYRKALELRPSFNEAYYNRGIAYEKQGNNEKAVVEFKKAYKYGLRSKSLYGRFVVHGLIEQ